MHSVNTLEEFLEVVLEYRFPGISAKHKVEETNKGYRIACPICGDSETKVSSRRGNIYTNTNTYKCFNGGCHAFMSLGNLVAKYASQYDIDIINMDINMESEYKTDVLNIKNVGSNAIRNYLFDIGAVQHMPDINYFTQRLGLTPIKNASINSAVYQYIANRNLFDTEENINSYFKDAFDNKVYMVNHDYETQKVISISTRDIDKKVYRVYPLSDLLNKMFQNPEIIPDIETIDSLSNIFNIFNVDFTKPIKITEGPIDGAFLYNYLAVQGISKTSMLFDFVDPALTFIIFDNDRPGRMSAINALKDGMNVFMWSNIVKILKKLYYKQMHRVIHTKDVENIYSLIKDNNKIDIKTFNIFIDKFFGNHPLDIFNV